ncbi:MAG TPA: exodeoxyribonuclease VII large subunit [Anaerolineales bacterium]
MTQLSFFQPPSWTVTDLTRYLRELLESDDNLQDVWVQGEVSNLSNPSSGHLYFTLKDSGASLKCVMWRNSVLRQVFRPKEGDAVEAHGNISIYESSGQYQLYADLIRPAGEGVLYQEFLRLKARLQAEGLFEEARKRPIPRWPHTIGIVTSPTGAALRDILNTLRRRYPLVNVVLAPTSVQGGDAPPGIIAAIRQLNRSVQPDVILLARGGGSIEDLWAFNDEGVARAIVDSEAPVIAGVGHEIDFTIADFACDLRAPTPTAAAELATQNQADLRIDLEDFEQRMLRNIAACLAAFRDRLVSIQTSLRMRSPAVRVRSGRQRLDDLSHRSTIALRHKLELQEVRLSGFEQRLSALNPLAVLERGYAVVTLADGRKVTSPGQVSPGDELNVRVRDGEFGAQVQETGAEQRR